MRFLVGLWTCIAAVFDSFFGAMTDRRAARAEELRARKQIDAVNRELGRLRDE